MEKWKCSVCGYVHEGPMTDGFKCPRCGAPASAFVKLEDAKKAGKPLRRHQNGKEPASRVRRRKPGAQQVHLLRAGRRP